MMQLFLKDIVPAAQNNIDTRFIILDKASNGKNCIALVADETAAVHIQLWGDECDVFEAGDIVKLTNGIFSYVRNNGLILTVAFVETPNVSNIQWNPDPEKVRITLYPQRRRSSFIPVFSLLCIYDLMAWS